LPKKIVSTITKVTNNGQIYSRQNNDKNYIEIKGKSNIATKTIDAMNLKYNKWNKNSNTKKKSIYKINSTNNQMISRDVTLAKLTEQITYPSEQDLNNNSTLNANIGKNQLGLTKDNLKTCNKTNKIHHKSQYKRSLR
jgi:hypothetical protein